MREPPALLPATFAVIIAFAGIACAAETRFPIAGHLKDPSILCGEDGSYYLTGTTNINTLDPKFADFQNNDGIRLWKSTDLKSWEEVGLIWNLKTDPYKKRRKTIHSQWQSHLRLVPGEPEREWSRGVTSPEIHRIKGGYYVIFAMNDQAVGLLKSSSGKPEGPYEEVDRLPNRFLGGDPSLFEDTDGRVYCLWGAGCIARMKDDLSDFAEIPWSLQTRIAGFPMDVTLPGQRDERAPFLTKRDGKYRYIFTATTQRDGKLHTDTLVCEGERLEGPYSPPKLLLPDGGQVTVFKDGSGSDRLAVGANTNGILIEPLN